MKSRKFIYWQRFFCLLLGPALLVSLTSSFSFISSIETKGSSIAVDNFSNFYVTSENRIQKFTPDGKFLYRYEEYRYGKFGMLDVTNPMKLLIFYPDFLTVTTLDRFLAPISTYNFFNLGYQNITAVASSSDNRIWFYDNIDFKLKKMDENGKIVRESQPLNIITGEVPVPNFIMEKDNKVYINDSATGIMVFDIFGSYSRTIPLKGLRKFQILKEQIIYLDDNRLQTYNPVTLEIKAVALPDTSEIIQAVLEKDRLGILKRDRVDFYKY